jgi:hypothetical protein
MPLKNVHPRAAHSNNGNRHNACIHACPHHGKENGMIEHENEMIEHEHSLIVATISRLKL